MATVTPNIGLTLPAGNEKVSRQTINDNMTIIDTAFGNAHDSSVDSMQAGLSNVVDGDTTDEAISAGAYAYIKNNEHGLSEGYYQNTSGSAFPASGGTADSTVFTPVSTAGILNSLNNNFTWQDILSSPVSAIGTCTLTESIENFKELLFVGYNSASAANYTTIVPVSAFKQMNESSKGMVIRFFVNNTNYYIKFHYSNNTTIAIVGVSDFTMKNVFAR